MAAAAVCRIHTAPVTWRRYSDVPDRSAARSSARWARWHRENGAITARAVRLVVLRVLRPTGRSDCVVGAMRHAWTVAGH